MKNIFFIVFLFINFFASIDKTFSYDIEVMYIERPPFYYVTSNGPKGLIMDKVVDIFNKSGINVKYTLSTSNRIYFMFLRGERRICSPGWFRTKQREEFAKFSFPIHQDAPVVLLTKRENVDLKNYVTLKEVFKNKSFIWGKINYFSYGNYVDDLAMKLKPKTIKIDGTQDNLIAMLKYERITYMLINPLEIKYLLERKGYDINQFMVVNLNDIPMGNKRYLMFSKDVSDNLLKKINSTILKYYKIKRE